VACLKHLLPRAARFQRAQRSIAPSLFRPSNHTFRHTSMSATFLRLPRVATNRRRPQSPSRLLLRASSNSIPLKLLHDALEKILKQYLDRLENHRPPQTNATVEIPVCYGGQHGPGSAGCKCAPQNGRPPPSDRAPFVNHLRSSIFLGFVSGIRVPRRTCRQHWSPPRLATHRAAAVPPGSVGIAGNQTGVYIHSPRPAAGDCSGALHFFHLSSHSAES